MGQGETQPEFWPVVDRIFHTTLPVALLLSDLLTMGDTDVCDLISSIFCGYSHLLPRILKYLETKAAVSCWYGCCEICKFCLLAFGRNPTRHQYILTRPNSVFRVIQPSLYYRPAFLSSDQCSYLYINQQFFFRIFLLNVAKYYWKQHQYKNFCVGKIHPMFNIQDVNNELSFCRIDISLNVW